jgi:hypothetical protein
MIPLAAWPWLMPKQIMVFLLLDFSPSRLNLEAITNQDPHITTQIQPPTVDYRE